MLKDSEIRAAIKAKIEEGLALFYSGENPPVDVNVYGYWVLAHRDGESAALLRVRTGRDKGKVHTWMIGSNSSRITRSDMHGKDPVAFAMTGGLKKSGVNRRDVVKSYKIWAYLEYNDDGDELNNSENQLTEEVEYVVNYLAKRKQIEVGSEAFGKAFENWLINEVRSYNTYNKRGWDLSYWRLSSGGEVDLILNDGELAIEFKCAQRLTNHHLKGLRELKADHPKLKDRYLVNLDTVTSKTEDGITIYPADVFLDKLWGGALLF